MKRIQHRADKSDHDKIFLKDGGTASTTARSLFVKRLSSSNAPAEWTKESELSTKMISSLQVESGSVCVFAQKSLEDKFIAA